MLHEDAFRIGSVKRGDDRIGEVLRTGRPEESAAAVDAYLRGIGYSSLPELLRSYIAVDIYLTAREFACSLGVEAEQFTTACGGLTEMSAHLQSPERTAAYFHGIAAQCIWWRMAAVGGQGGSVIRKARDYIDRSYMQTDLSLRSVSEAIGLSPTYFSALFKRETGQNFSDYLTEVRIRRAKDLLCCTSKLISEIAYDVGFRDYRYFSQIFKKHTGQTPRQYQNAAKRIR